MTAFTQTVQPGTGRRGIVWEYGRMFSGNRKLMLAGVLSAGLLSGCQDVDGTWSMDCAAFAGDRLTFADGEYTWNKVTDARRLDAQGRPVDPYPDYPKSGPYTRDGDALVFIDGETGGELARFYLHERGGAMDILTAEEHEAVAAGGEYPSCPLRRTADE